MAANSYFEERKYCPACLSNEVIELYYNSNIIREYYKDTLWYKSGVGLKFIKGIDYILDKCKNCGLIYQRLVPSDILLGKLYEDWFDHRSVLKRKLLSYNYRHYKYLSIQVEHVIKYFNIKPINLNFLDFGMGTGDWCRMARAFGCNVFGTDLSKSQIQESSKSDINIISYEDIHNNYHFDLININHVMEHLVLPNQTLGYLIKALKPNGLIHIAVPDSSNTEINLNKLDNNPTADIRDLLFTAQPFYHINSFSYNSIKIMGKYFGLELKIIPRYLGIMQLRDILDISLKDILRPIYTMLLRMNHSAKREVSLYLCQKPKKK